MKKSNKGHHN